MNKPRLLALALTLVLALSACAAPVEPSAPSAEHPSGAAPNSLPNGGELTATYTAAKVTTQSPDEAFFRGQYTLAAAALRYAYAHRDGENANLLLSPLSISGALGMTALGADGQTLRQMEAVLGLSADQFSQVLAAYREELEQLYDAKCLLANSVWLEQGLADAIQPAFLQNVVDYYRATVYARTFDDDTLALLNRWTSEHTDGMIPKLLNAFPPGAEMLLVNALCFDAKWAEPFNPDATAPQPFHGENGDSEVSMMHGTTDIYLSAANATGFARPYKGNSSYFVALLPAEGVSMEDFLAALDADAFLALKETARTANVSVSLPQFTDDCSFTLKTMLQEMGMTDAFDAGKADFSRMSSAGLYIDDVIHKTYIEMTEAGTRAAAVTAVIMVRGLPPAQQESVVLDRPFVYAIVDGQSFLPLFIGCVTDLP